MNRGRHQFARRRQTAASGREHIVIISCDGAVIARLAAVNPIYRQYEARATGWFGVQA